DTQHNLLPVIQIADLGGAYAVSFVVAAVNALIFELLHARAGLRRLLALPETVTPRGPGLAVQSLAVGLLVSATVAYGFWRLNQDALTPGPRVALLQGNVPQAVRNEKHDADTPEERQRAADSISHGYLPLHDIAEKGHPALIVWPETSYPKDWLEQSQEYMRAALESARRKPPPEWKGVPLP